MVDLNSIVKQICRLPILQLLEPFDGIPEYRLIFFRECLSPAGHENFRFSFYFSWKIHATSRWFHVFDILSFSGSMFLIFFHSVAPCF